MFTMLTLTGLNSRISAREAERSEPRHPGWRWTRLTATIFVVLLCMVMTTTACSDDDDFSDLTPEQRPLPAG
jgi:hypothetical protein